MEITLKLLLISLLCSCATSSKTTCTESFMEKKCEATLFEFKLF